MTALRIMAVAALLQGAGVAFAAPADELDDAFGKDTLVISADSNACWLFDVYVASTRAQQMRGLMHVRELPPFTGMIFVYQQAGIRSMWMKNTYLPLDMLFIRGDGTVSSVAAHTTPLSLTSVSSNEPVNFVLELNAGVTGTLDIGTHSRIIFGHVE